MSAPIPNLEPAAPNPEQVRLKASFDELRKNQITFLNEAGKRVIELSTGMIGLVFTVLAFGKDFPPPYLAEAGAKAAAAFSLACFFLALLAGLFCVQPQEYPDFPHNLDGMRKVLAEHNRWKAGWFRAGSVLFGLGVLGLVLLIATIVF